MTPVPGRQSSLGPFEVGRCCFCASSLLKLLPSAPREQHSATLLARASDAKWLLAQLRCDPLLPAHDTARRLTTQEMGMSCIAHDILRCTRSSSGHGRTSKNSRRLGRESSTSGTQRHRHRTDQIGRGPRIVLRALRLGIPLRRPARSAHTSYRACMGASH